MVRGRRQNPDAIPSRQLEISRAFRQRKANDLKDLRERAAYLEKENVELRQECERLRVALVRRSSSSFTGISSTTTSTSNHTEHQQQQQQQNPLPFTPSQPQPQHAPPQQERLYHSGEMNGNHRTDQQSHHSSEGEDLMANFDGNWSTVQAELDRYSHNADGGLNNHQQQAQTHPPQSQMNGSVHEGSAVYGYQPTNGSTIVHQSQPQPQQMNTPVIRLTNEMQSFESPQLRNEGQMMHHQQQQPQRPLLHHHQTSMSDQHNYSHHQHHAHNHHSRPQHDQDSETISAQRLWEFAVHRPSQHNNGNNHYSHSNNNNCSLEDSKCCGGIFDCDESGQIKVETPPPHIAYPA